ncbi:hypothetical protein, partial [Sphingomonas sp.]|uniref:hypothetical protein n=1 Tax=Sphingomonas sp. TaxID=28214 RepID=UPI0031D6ECC7
MTVFIPLPGITGNQDLEFAVWSGTRQVAFREGPRSGEMRRRHSKQILPLAGEDWNRMPIGLEAPPKGDPMR